MSNETSSAGMVRAKVTRAADHVVPTWPIASFIAVNPMRSMEKGQFGEDRHATAPSAGIAYTRNRTAYQRDFASGRITSDDLRAAISERVPELRSHYRDTPFDEAFYLDLLVADVLESNDARPVARPRDTADLDLVNTITSGWLAAFLTTDETVWQMPHRELGFYGSWRTLARHDPRIPRRARRRSTDLPSTCEMAVQVALQRLAIGRADTEAVLREEIDALPGWASHVKWRSENTGDIDLAQYLAVRLSLRVLLLENGNSPHPDHRLEKPQRTAPAGSRDSRDRARRALQRIGETDEHLVIAARVLESHPVTDHSVTWQVAYERHYRMNVLASLDRIRTDSAIQTASDRTDRVDVHVVTCIDPRSEGLRRHLEDFASAPSGLGRVETFGFAGFFAVPMRFTALDARGSVDSLPALLRARHSTTEIAVSNDEAVRRRRGLLTLEALDHSAHAGKTFGVSPFALAEATGLFFGVASFLRTVAPSTFERMRGWIGALIAPPTAADVTVQLAYSLPERILIAEASLRMMGMAITAPLVVLTGHGSRTMNNLYQSALDCGACGGHSGAPNARAAAAIFNDPLVRQSLSTRGLVVSSDTVFVAAEHNTVTDELLLLDEHLLPATHRGMWDRFARAASGASDRLVRERAVELPGASSRHRPSRVRRRSRDWAEVYPELGLAGNAALIIGPRSLTRGVDLSRRAFLHSYESALDPDGSALETILTAPLVVAQWINHQYYFSALNPETLGAGTKTIHNAVGTLGVFSGYGGDLRRGLPWQSVGFGRELLHEPMRLAVIAQAPLELLGAIISRNEVLRNLFDNEWMTLTARDDAMGAWQRYTRYGWQDFSRDIHPDQPKGH